MRKKACRSTNEYLSVVSRKGYLFSAGEESSITDRPPKHLKRLSQNADL